MPIFPKVALASLLTVILAVLPGSWLFFSVRISALDRLTKLALAAALSPAVIGVQLVLLEFLGIAFEKAAVVVVLANLPCLLLVWFSLRDVPRPSASRDALYPLLALGILGGSLVSLWVGIPQFRPFAWHALMHTEMIYQVARAGVLPEEPELGGLTLSYSWLGDSVPAVVARVSDVAPTTVYPVANLVWLTVCFILAYKLAVAGFGLRGKWAVASAGLMFMATQIAGVAAMVAVNDSDRWYYYVNHQVTALLVVFHGFENMPYAVALLLGLAVVVLTSVRSRLDQAPLLTSAVLTALGLIYPLLFPVGVVLVCAQVVIVSTSVAEHVPQYSRRQRVLMVAGLVVSGVVAAAALRMVSVDTTGTSSVLAMTGRKAKAVQAISALGPLLLLASSYATRSGWWRQAPAIVMGAVALACPLLYVLLSLGELEYKYITVASIFLAPLAVAGIMRMGPGRGGQAVALGLAVVCFVVQQLYVFEVEALIPRNLATAPPMREESFELSLDPSNRDAAWIGVVRDATPMNTMVIARGLPLYVGPFVRRVLYFPADADGDASAGYSMKNRVHLVTQRKYPEALYEFRSNVMSELYRASDPSTLRGVLDVLLSYRRPIAIHVSTAEASELLRWLGQEGIGSELYRDSHQVVWFIEAASWRQ